MPVSHHATIAITIAACWCHPRRMDVPVLAPRFLPRVARYAVLLNDTNLVIRRADLRARGATGFGTSVNAAVGSVNVT